MASSTAYSVLLERRTANGRTTNGAATAGKFNGITVARTNTGRYTVTFATPAPDAEYTVLLTIETNAQRDDIAARYLSTTTAGFDVQITEQDNGGNAGIYRDYPFSVLVIY